MLEVRKLSHVVNFLLLCTNLALHNVRLKALAEVGCAYTSVDDREDNQDNRDDRETGKTLSNW